MVRSEDVDAVLAGTQLVGSLIAESVASVGQQVTMPQLRVLILAGADGALNLAAVARDLGVHPSNATRTCDRLVSEGLLDRRTSATDRRHLALSLTPAGRRLVNKVMSHRRRRVEQLLNRMSPLDRGALARSLRSLVEADDSAG